MTVAIDPQTRSRDGERVFEASQTKGIRCLWPYVRSQRKKLVSAAVLALVSAGLSLFQPMVVNRLISQVQIIGSSVAWLVVGLVLVIVGGAVTSGCQQYLLGKIGEGVVRESRLTLVRSVMRMPIGESHKRDVGDLIARITSDTQMIRAAVSGALVGLLSSSVTIVGAIVALVWLDSVTFLISVSVAALAVGVSVIASRPVRHVNVEVQTTVGLLAGLLQRSLSGLRLIRAHGAQQPEILKIEDTVGSAYSKGLKLAKISAIAGPISSTLTGLALVIAIVVGGIRAASGGMNLASLVTFLMFFNLLIGPLNQFSSAILQIQQALAGHQRISEIVSIPAEDSCDHPDADAEILFEKLARGLVGPSVSLNGVCHSYDGERKALDRVSFSAAGGKLTAIVGPSGAGKSTILGLVERFYEYDSGQVCVGGIPVTDIGREQLRETIGYVDQGADAISGTLRENLLLGKPDLGNDALLEVIEQSSLQELVRRLPRGLDTEVGPAGVALSGGEKQRLSIARALLRHPKVLLLDEPTSNLDGRTEAEIHDVLTSLRPEITTIIVAHRLATVQSADHIVVMDQGMVVSEGTHEDLMHSSPLYQSLAKNQLIAPLDAAEVLL
jgi:ABC-type multidrug transport system, ATPase and permease components